MQFLVRLEVNTPSDWGDGRLEALREAESERAMQFLREGRIERLFCVPGLQGNLGVWQADSLEQLHRALAELPTWPVTKSFITPLITRPREQLLAQKRCTQMSNRTDQGEVHKDDVIRTQRRRLRSPERRPDVPPAPRSG